jgi:predicted MFS family arabinose efflux permease
MILLYTLAAMQFTHILDFMIVMPLGPRLMEIFKVTPSQFGIIVSTYTFSAGLFGLAAAWFLDRFDRKTALMSLYAGFGLGTVACALAPSFPFLVAARFIAGGFGGVATATILAVIGDAIPPARKGEAMGTIFSSFSLASVAGVPAGLFLANHLGWHAPFFLLGGLSIVILVAAGMILPSMRDHMKQGSRAGNGPGDAAIPAKPKPWEEMGEILGKANHWRAFGLTVFMTMAGFLLIPYISPSLVSNCGLTNEQLPYIYLCGGAATFFSMRWLGRISDRLGLLRVFTAVSIIAVVPILALSHLPRVPLWIALIVTTLFMVFTSGRFIPGMAMVTNSVEGRYRGGFMSINSALQQFASGAAAALAGAVVALSPQGRLLHYGAVGLLGAGSILVSLFFAKKLKPE